MGFSGVREAWPPAMTVHFPACSFSGVSKAWPCVWANGVGWTGVGSSDEAISAFGYGRVPKRLALALLGRYGWNRSTAGAPLALALILEASALCPRTGG